MQQQYEEKNIRRRVYDALNVLMAMDIISKEKKEIQWKGLPSTSVEDIEQLEVCPDILNGELNLIVLGPGNELTQVFFKQEEKKN